MSYRAATIFTAAGACTAGLVGAAVLLAGPAATAATTCAATTTPSATASASASDEPTDEPSETPSETPTSTPSPTQNPGLPLPIDLPLLGGAATTSATPTATASETPEETASPTPTTSTTLAVSPRRVVKGDPVRLTGKGLPGCKVTIYGAVRPATTYKALASGTIADNGTFGFTLKPGTNTKYVAGSQGAKSSATVPENVRRVVTLKVIRIATRTYRFEGTVDPKTAGVPITVFRTANGQNVKVGSTKSNSNGLWATNIKFPASTTYVFYALGDTTADNDSNRSGLVKVAIH